LPDCAKWRKAVVGQPDPQWGEVGEAFVVLAPDAALSADDIIRQVRANLATYKAPRRVSFVTSLPRTASGKVRKADLRKAASSAAGGWCARTCDPSGGTVDLRLS
jgi:acyl-CoA synthetase (AMP-forming)/AMP-acid ligase II